MAKIKLTMDNLPCLNDKIIIPCNLHCNIIYIFEVFCRIDPSRHDNFLKMTSSQTMKWQWRCSVSNLGPLDRLFNNLFRLTTKQTQTHRIIDPLWGESVCHRCFLLTNGSIVRKAFPWHDAIPLAPILRLLRVCHHPLPVIDGFKSDMVRKIVVLLRKQTQFS